MTTMQPAVSGPGIYDDIPMEQYLELPHLSRSDLLLFDRSPGHYFAKRKAPDREPETDTPAKKAGKILHTAILEPDNFERLYVVVPADAPRKPSITQREAKAPSKSTIFSIDWWDAFEESNKGKEIIDAELWEKCRRTADSVRAHPELRGFLKGGKAERTIIAVDPETGLLCKMRPDYITTLDGLTVITDIKSAEDARHDKFHRDAWNYGYFHQHIYYRNGYEWCTGKAPDLFLIAAFEKEPPYAVKLYEPAEDSLARAMKDIRRWLNLAAECFKSNQFPMYATDIERLHKPGWVKDE